NEREIFAGVCYTFSLAPDQRKPWRAWRPKETGALPSQVLSSLRNPSSIPDRSKGHRFRCRGTAMAPNWEVQGPGWRSTCAVRRHGPSGSLHAYSAPASKVVPPPGVEPELWRRLDSDAEGELLAGPERRLQLEVLKGSSPRNPCLGRPIRLPAIDARQQIFLS